MTSVNEQARAETQRGFVESGLNAIQRAEAQLTRLLNESRDERYVMNLARAMHHLALARIQLELPGWHDSRAHSRTRESAVILIEVDGHPPIEAALHDISPGGALVECDVPLAEGLVCRMSLPELQEWAEARCCGSRAGLTHLAFEPETIKQLLPLIKHLDRKSGRY
jgi:hypothetical protein